MDRGRFLGPEIAALPELAAISGTVGGWISAGSQAIDGARGGIGL